MKAVSFHEGILSGPRLRGETCGLVERRGQETRAERGRGQETERGRGQETRAEREEVISLPLEYSNFAKTPLRAEVHAGTQTIDFDIPQKGP